jgi:predicted DsbA family dithiol-disulfide isomerase
VFADLGCPWAHVAISRLHRARSKLGLEAAVRFDIRVFPLELLNLQPTPFRGVQSEITPLSEIEPDAGWQLWAAEPTTWPVTLLPAMEAVEAAKEQGLEASEHLDLELRRALFARSECISMRHVILDVAKGCGRVDADVLSEAMDDGRARRPMLEGYRKAEGAVHGSPHLFASDGTSAHNPGVEFHWEKSPRRLVIDRDEPAVYDDILRRAAR